MSPSRRLKGDTVTTIYRVHTDEGTRVSGYLVIDSLGSGHSYGGLRMAPEISLDSLVQAARTMTLKYAFVGLPFGGAKAGIIGDPEMPQNEKRELLQSFGRALKPILQTKTYIPGGDLGISDDEVRFMLTSNGIKVLPRALVHRTAGFYAGLTVFTAAASAAEHIGIDLSHASVAVEGFGSVGSSVADAFWKRGSKVIAISTSRGAIYNPEGLDIGELMSLRKQFGSSVVDEYERAERIDKSKLAILSVDIFCPCAQPYSITSENARHATAKIISPGANVPTTADAEEILFQKGIISLPDFVANCGGILAASMKRAGLSDNFVRQFIEQKFRHKVSSMLKTAEKEGIPISEYAQRTTVAKLQRLKEATQRRSFINNILNLARELYRNGVIPYQLFTPLAPRYFNNRFEF